MVRADPSSRNFVSLRGRYFYRFFGSLECAAEPLRIYSPPLCEPRSARRANSVRAILRIHRNSGFRKWKKDASRHVSHRELTSSNLHFPNWRYLLVKIRTFLTKILPRRKPKDFLRGRTLNFYCSRLWRDGRAENFSARAGREEKGVREECGVYRFFGISSNLLSYNLERIDILINLLCLVVVEH
jgi:hypothetical protein